MRYTIYHKELDTEFEVEVDTQGYMKSPPHVLIIEPTNRCNLRCPMCTNFLLSSRGKLEQGNMPLHSYLRLKSFMREAALVALTGFGEPYLHPALFEFIRIARQMGAKTALTTNGVLLPGHRSLRTVESGLDFIEVSYDGKRGNPRYRGVDAKATLAGVRSLNRAKEELGERKPEITFASVLGTGNLKDVEEIVRTASELGVDEVRFQPIQIFTRDMMDENLYQIKRKAERALSSATDLGRDLGVNVKARRSTLALDERYSRERTYLSSYSKELGCVDPFARFFVSWNGDVLLCCGGIPTHLNISDRPLWDIWNSNIYRAYRMDLLGGRPRGFCSHCPQIFGSLENQVTFLGE